MKNFDIKNVDVVKFLEELEIRNIEEQGDEVNFSCPFPGHRSGDQNPSAYMNADTTAFYCHGCKRKGNALTFLSDLFNFSYPASIRFLSDRFGSGFKMPSSTLQAEIDEFFVDAGKPEAEILNYPLQDKVLSDFHLKYSTEALEYLYNRGFKRATIESFQLGWDEHSQRITIPIFDEVGRLVGFKGRAISDENKPKYKVLGGSYYGFPRYHPGLVVYGVNMVEKDIKSCILVEGELNAVAMHQLGWPNTVAIGGSTFTQTQARKIISRFNAAMIYFDSDAAGYEATVKAIHLLDPHIKTYVAPEHDADPAELLETLQTHEAVNEVCRVTSEAVDTLKLMLN